MKKTINGVRYDSRKAIKIGGMQNHQPGDFEYCDETLYATPRSGRFFLHGRGGPGSRWAKTIDGDLKEGEGVLPLSRSSAREWAEHHLAVDLDIDLKEKEI